MRAVVSALALCAACAPSPAPVRSCADDLTGIWAAADGRRFHLVERRDHLEVYPLFDANPDKERRPWRTPAKTELVRSGDALVGKSTFQAQGDRLCTIVTPARLEACAGNRARLAIELAPELDLASCAAPPAASTGLEISRL
jgi:hypothetical protein